MVKKMIKTEVLDKIIDVFVERYNISMGNCRRSQIGSYVEEYYKGKMIAFDEAATYVRNVKEGEKKGK